MVVVLYVGCPLYIPLASLPLFVSEKSKKSEDHPTFLKNEKIEVFDFILV
jgi:hypothetical protein